MNNAVNENVNRCRPRNEVCANVVVGGTVFPPRGVGGGLDGGGLWWREKSTLKLSIYLKAFVISIGFPINVSSSNPGNPICN